jgi:hypothetical protein
VDESFLFKEILMVTKDILIQEPKETHRQIHQLVEQVERRLKIYPDWMTRELLVNITSWVDSEADCEALSFEQIFPKWLQTHEQLKIAIPKSPQEKMEA